MRQLVFRLPLPLVAIMLAACGPASSAAPQPADQTTAWRQDLAFLARELPKRHKNAFHHTPANEFSRSVAALDAAIPRSSPDAILVGLLKITAAVGDSHTSVRLPSVRGRYPLRLSWFGDDLRVIAAAPAHERALGSKVVKIGGHDIGEALTRVRTVLAQAENEGWVRAQSPGYLMRPEILSGLGIVPAEGPAVFTFEQASGARFELAITPAPLKPPPRMISAAAAEPLWRQRPDEGFWFTRLPDSTVYVVFRSYDDLEGNARKLFATLDAAPAKRLVIDMRQNSGGDFTKVREQVIPQIRRRPTVNRPGGLYVVIGRGTLSAAMNNAADFRGSTKAVLVGEPTGARPNGYQEGREMQLPNSGLTVSYSTRYYRFAKNDDPAVAPDRNIPPDWESFAAGGDLVMEWILDQP